MTCFTEYSPMTSRESYIFILVVYRFENRTVPFSSLVVYRSENRTVPFSDPFSDERQATSNESNAKPQIEELEQEKLQTLT